jgi:hypothetical protein
MAGDKEVTPAGKRELFIYEFGDFYQDDMLLFLPRSRE